MIALALCLLAFSLAFERSLRSLGAGLGVVLVAGYAYGITRANLPSVASHFLFDAALLGVYAAQVTRRPTPAGRRLLGAVLPWFTALMLWSCLMFLVPTQPYLVQLVGLRAAVFLVPLLLLGALLRRDDLDRLARLVAVLNLIAVGFALLEYFLGLEPFYPYGPTSITIYAARDVAGGSYRLPATFSSAHHFGNTMVATLPLLVIRLLRDDVGARERRLLIAAIPASCLGVFLCGARTPAAHLVAVGGLFLLLSRVAIRTKRLLVTVGLLTALVVANEPRLQRAVLLSDPERLSRRIGKALDLSLYEVVTRYPLGSGMGTAWGTSIPYFLADQVTVRLGAENELVRLTLELGLPGLLLWLGLAVWVVARAPPPARSRAELEGTRLIRIYVGVVWATAFIGAGLLLSVPMSAILLVYMGYLGRVPARTPARPLAPRSTSPPLRPEPTA